MDNNVSLGYLLNSAARLAKGNITGRMDTLGLTFPQSMVLKVIKENENNSQLTMAAIARRLNSNRPNIMGIVDRLEKQGLVNRTVNPKNRSAYIITLTNEARAVMQRLQDMSQQTTDEALSGFTKEEAATVREYLTRIVANLS